MSEQPAAPTAAQPEPLHHRTFTNRLLRESRFVNCDLGDVVVRGSNVDGIELDDPWLRPGDSHVWVNGVDVLPLVDAELNRRFPGRELRRAATPEGLREAWSALESTWAATLARASGMPEGTVEASVADEWSLAETLRHLVFATDIWFGRAVLGLEQPCHPMGLRHDDGDDDESAACDPAVLTQTDPSYEEVLAVRAERQGQIREFLAGVTPELLAEERRNPHNPEHPETVLSCLHTILKEEWEHHRFAVRDLDALAAG